MAYARVDFKAHTSPTRFLVMGMLILALGLLGWRAVTTFTATPAQAPASELSSLVETITGQNRASTALSETGTPIILIDGPEGTLTTLEIARLRELASALYPAGGPAIIKQYPFASGTPTRPSPAALAELAALAILAGLTGWFALTMTQSARKAEPMSALPASPLSARAPKAEMPAKAPSPTPAHSAQDPAQDPLARAAEIARQDPKATAAIIRNWLHREGGHA